MAVTEADLVAALVTKFMTAAETVNLVDFTKVGTPAFEGSTSAFPNSRNEKFLDFNGTTDRYSFDGRGYNSNNQVVHFWIKPDFIQTNANTRCIVGSYNNNLGGIRVQFFPADDDWKTFVWGSGGAQAAATTSGETWSVDDVIHVTILIKEDNGLDNTKTCAIYINNVLKVTDTNAAWTGGVFNTVSNIGAYYGAAPGWFWDGGIFDLAFLNYDTLSASYTDTEIVQALYSNTLDSGTDHKFVYELEGVVTDAGRTIAGRKLRFRTNTDVTTTTALEIDDAQEITVTESVLPLTDNNSDLGSATQEYRDLYIDGTANIDSLVADTVDINAGTIDDTAIGSTSTSTAKFTTLENSGVHTNTNNTASTTGATGALIVNGGVGVGGRLCVANGASLGDGGITDYIDISNEGHLILQGKATVWKDINMSSAQLSRPTSSQPDLVNFVDEAGADTGIQTYGFAVGEKVHGGFELQHDYKQGSDFTFHVHWQGITAPTGTDNVQWRLTYTVMRDGATLDATTIIDSPDDTITAQYMAVRSDFAAITGTNYLIGDQFLFTLERVASTGDAYAGDALIATAGIHYECDTIGSNLIITK